MEARELERALEAILLVAERPVSIQELATATGTMVSAVQKALAELMRHYENRGIRLIRKSEYVQLVSAPETAPAIGRFFKKELREELSRPALETLAIVVYREPITRGQVEEIRGVNSEAILRTLLMRGLIREVGRSATLGRPILYGTTMEFLQYFGIESPEKLPPLQSKLLPRAKPDGVLFDPQGS